MRKYISYFVFFATFVVLAMPVSARAELSIAVVDIEKILSEAKASKAVQKQVEDLRKSFLSEVETAEKKLRKEQTEIQEKREGMSQEDLAKKVQALSQSQMEARKKIQERKAKLDTAYTEAMNKLTKTIYEVCQKIADEREIELIITRQNIIVGSMSLDITADVLKEIDTTLPKLSVDVKK